MCLWRLGMGIMLGESFYLVFCVLGFVFKLFFLGSWDGDGDGGWDREMKEFVIGMWMWMWMLMRSK
jgi:hypothetical protein